MPDELLVRSTHELTPSLRAAVVALCDRAYEEEIGPLFDSLGPMQHMLLFADGLLVSHAAWVRRYVRAASGPILDTAYVELVATDPDHQGRGLARRVLGALVAHIGPLYEIAALSPSDVGFYARLGWEEWLGPLQVRTAAGEEDVPDETAMIHRLARTPPLDLAAPLSIEWRSGDIW
ncbi:MAG: GNAT family N-acetyltransferase [Hyphomonadaceae bacterium]|nr:GNAT family N-acetyltransferase [Hyphomonadaceae bacterium]